VKSVGQRLNIHAVMESDKRIVARKPANTMSKHIHKAEPVEQRRLTTRNGELCRT